MIKKAQTVVELPEYIKQAEGCIDQQSRTEFIDYIARHPMKGDLIRGTGGARKIRWAGIQNKGKSGGVRIIYYYHSRDIPIFLLTAYGKGKKANLAQAERNTLKALLNQLVNLYLGGGRL